MVINSIKIKVCKGIFKKIHFKAYFVSSTHFFQIKMEKRPLIEWKKI